MCVGVTGSREWGERERQPVGETEGGAGQGRTGPGGSAGPSQEGRAQDTGPGEQATGWGATGKVHSNIQPELAFFEKKEPSCWV